MDPVFHTPVLYSYHGESEGGAGWVKVKEGHLDESDIKTDDVMLINVTCCIFVCVGDESPSDEQRDCMIMAQKPTTRRSLAISKCGDNKVEGQSPAGAADRRDANTESSPSRSLPALGLQLDIPLGCAPGQLLRLHIEYTAYALE